jgi:hypothetical protein
MYHLIYVEGGKALDLGGNASLWVYFLLCIHASSIRIKELLNVLLGHHLLLRYYLLRLWLWLLLLGFRYLMRVVSA